MATTADTSDKSQMAKASDATDSARIGWAFLSQYYSYLNKDPARLHCFYTKRSTLIHSTEGEETVACYGQQEIHAKIMSLAFEDCKVYISNVDSQSSAEGGIIVQVIGEMSNSNGAWRKFAQTFFLAEQPNGYFVLNDICRYIKEEGDEDVTPAPASTSAQPEQSSSSPAPVPSASPSNDNAPTSVESVLFNDVKPAQDLVKEEESTTVASSEPATAESSFTFGSEAVAAQPNGKDAATVNGDAEKVEEPAAAVEVEPLTEVEHKSNEAPPPLIEEPAPPAPVVEEVKKADKEEEIAESVAPVESKAPVESAPSEPTPPTPQASSSPAPASTPAPASPAVSAPAPAPTPAAPAAPKSWASLAASNTNKWGSMASASKGASAAPQKQAEPSTPSAPTPSASNSTAPSSSAQPPSNFTEQVQAVVHSNCFVKGVVEFVTEKQLREVLTSRFGPLKELDIIRSKACAFVEFINLNDARKAIQVSMRHQDGGENGITFETSTGDKARINVVERKPHNERPPPRPRQAGEGAGGSSAQGQGKGQGGQQQKDGQGQRSGGQGGRGGANSGRNQGNRGGRTGGGGGSRQGSGQTQQQKQ